MFGNNFGPGFGGGLPFGQPPVGGTDDAPADGEPPAKRIKLPSFGGDKPVVDANDPMGPLAPGESREWPGSGSSVYNIQRLGTRIEGRPNEAGKTGEYYQCSCPAFKFAKANKGVHWSAKSCKHIAALRGADKEALRVKNATEFRLAMGEAGDGEEGAAAPKSKAKAKGKAKAKAAAGGGLGSPAAGAQEHQAAASSSAAAATSSTDVLLAHVWDPSAKDVSGWWVSEKLDGVRAIWDGTSFRSRLGNTFVGVPKWFMQGLPPAGSKLQLDGELFLARGEFQKCVGIVKKHVGLDHDWQRMKFMVFDLMEEDKPEATFEDRMAKAKDVLKDTRYAKWHEHVKLNVSLDAGSPTGAAAGDEPASAAKRTLEVISDLLKRVEQKGGEGLMLREPKSKYEKKRSNTLLKVKSFFDMDCVVIGIEKGKGRNAGRMGALLCRDKEGVQFQVGTGHLQLEEKSFF
eukprot:g6373.t1